MNAGYAYLPEVATADVAFRAWGDDLGSLFAAAARAMVAVMVEPVESLAASSQHEVFLEGHSLDLLLHDFLQEILYAKDALHLLLLPLRVTLTPGATGARPASPAAAIHGYCLHGVLAGEAPDPIRHQLGTEVKAVTLHRLAVVQTASGWEAEVVLDI
jgi:SHS2 domain-containing protein